MPRERRRPDDLRSAKSFGVSGLLAEECHVFYENLFDSRGVGRVSDLLSAKLISLGADEQRLRTLLVFGAFTGMVAQLRAEGAGEGKGGANRFLEDPITLECGHDPNWVAVAVSFRTPAGMLEDLEGFLARAREACVRPVRERTALERLIGELARYSDDFFLRVHRGQGRAEAVALLSLAEAGAEEEEGDAAATAEIQLIELVDEITAEPPKPTTYAALGDLDYVRLLRGGMASLSTEEPNGTGDILVKSDEPGAEDDAVRLEGDKYVRQDSVKVTGGAEKLSSDLIRVKGGDGQKVEKTDALYRISSDQRVGVESNDPSRIYKEQVSALQRRIQGLEAEKVRLTALASDRARQSAITAAVGAVMGAREQDLDLAKTRGKGASGAGDDDSGAPAPKTKRPPRADGSEDVEEGEESSPKAKSDGKQEPKSGQEAPDGVEADASAKESPGKESSDAELKTLVKEMEDGALQAKIAQAQKESAEIKGELQTPKARRWVDGLMNELVVEKARLHEMAKKIQGYARQKEHEFRSKEQGYTDELRKREEMLRQRESALARSKDQIAQLQVALERSKTTQKDADGGAAFKQKYEMSQKMLELAKKEAIDVRKKQDELRAQLATAQMQAKTGTAVKDTTETAQLQSRMDRVQRQCDEFKKANQALMEQLADKKKERVASGATEEIRRKLEAAMKISAQHQKDAGVLKLRVEELQREEARLKKELAGYQKDKAKPGVGGGGVGGVGGGPGAPPKKAA